MQEHLRNIGGFGESRGRLRLVGSTIGEYAPRGITVQVHHAIEHRCLIGAILSIGIRILVAHDGSPLPIGLCSKIVFRYLLMFRKNVKKVEYSGCSGVKRQRRTIRQ